jgi:hypothetical protein
MMEFTLNTNLIMLWPLGVLNSSLKANLIITYIVFQK